MGKQTVFAEAGETCSGCGLLSISVKPAPVRDSLSMMLHKAMVDEVRSGRSLLERFDVGDQRGMPPGRR